MHGLKPYLYVFMLATVICVKVLIYSTTLSASSCSYQFHLVFTLKSILDIPGVRFLILIHKLILLILSSNNGKVLHFSFLFSFIFGIGKVLNNLNYWSDYFASTYPEATLTLAVSVIFDISILNTFALK